jgi:hypothetical protein
MNDTKGSLQTFFFFFLLFSDFMRQGGPGTAPGRGFQPRSGYDELDTTLMPPRPGEPYNRGSPEPSGSMSGSQGGPPALPFPIAPGSGGIQT